MNTATNDIVKRVASMLAIGLCFAFTGVPESSAHTIEFRPGFVDIRYGKSHRRPMPGWLRRNRDFQHWYWHNRYRFKRHGDWHRLYRIYLTDRHYVWHGRYYHDHYYDHGYVPYYRKRKHRHD